MIRFNLPVFLFICLFTTLVILYIPKFRNKANSSVTGAIVSSAQFQKNALVLAGAPDDTLVGTCVGVGETEKWEIGGFPTIPGTIFVSVASYRDNECKTTVFDMFAKAKSPDSVYVGVVQQNKEQKEDCFDLCPDCSKRKQSGHIRVTNFSYMEAKGPTFARYHASKLWQGEEFYLQIDSHLKFEQDWDVILLEQMRLAGPKAVVGGYPPTEDQLKQSRDNGYNETIVSCSNGLDADGMPNIGSAVVSVKPGHMPIKCMAMAAGFMAFPGTALREVPYDPMLSFLFFTEELLFSARMWTHGYDIYAIGKPVCSHHYGREGSPRYSTDHKEAEGCRVLALGRAKCLLGIIPLSDVHPDYAMDMEKYGMGKVRSLDDFWEKSGFHMKTGTTTKVCEVS